MNPNNNRIQEILSQIDHIKEYVNSEICKMCEDMKNKLQHCEDLLNEYSRSNMDDHKSNP